jgi:hypothetical protein
MRGGKRSEVRGGALWSDEGAQHPAAWCHARRRKLPCPCLRQLTSCLESRSLWCFRTFASHPKNRNRSAAEMDAQTPHQIKASKAEAGVGTPSKQNAEGARVPAHAHSRRSVRRAPDRHGPREPQATARPGLTGFAAASDGFAGSGSSRRPAPTPRRERLEAEAIGARNERVAAAGMPSDRPPNHPRASDGATRARCPFHSIGASRTRHLTSTGRAAAVDCELTGWPPLLRRPYDARPRMNARTRMTATPRTAIAPSTSGHAGVSLSSFRKFVSG